MTTSETIKAADGFNGLYIFQPIWRNKKEMRTKRLLLSFIFLASIWVNGSYATAMDHEGAHESAEEGSLRVAVDGKIVGNAVMSKDLSELLLPIRSISEALGAQVKWDSEHQAVLINTRLFPEMDHHTSMHSHVSIVYNDNMVDTGRDPIIQNGTLMVSANTITKALQVNVKFNADKNMVQVTTPGAIEQFDKEDQAVKDILNGVGMIPNITADGAKEFKLTAEIHPWAPIKGVLTNAWSYNGQAPGPTIRVKEGDHVRVTLLNNLPEATTIHWHGLHVPIEMDGVPDVSQKPIPPGQSFTYDFIASHPGTFIYHSHFNDMKQIGNGLYGAFIIDPKDGAANVTKYDHDYTMLLSGFQINGSESEKDYFTINGRSYPDTTPIVVKKGETVRLRLINIDSMEVHTMHLHGLDFQVIAKDGHPVPYPQTMNTVLIGPAETYDIAFKADAVGSWMFQCHILDHTMNGDDMSPGEMGGLVTYVKVTE
jgi:hypothetical protein